MAGRPYPSSNNFSDIQVSGGDGVQIGNNYYGDAQSCHPVFRTSPYEDHKRRNPDRVEGTCQWFLKHPMYINWQRGSTSLLWVSADPGCGKSVLSKSLIDQELLTSKTRTTCYFFFKDDNDAQKRACNALCALIHQLFTQKPSLLRHAESVYKVYGTDLKESFKPLWDILITAAADPEAGEIVCVLDALDECDESERDHLLDTLCTFYQETHDGKVDINLKFLVTSRPYHSIQSRFNKVTKKIPKIHLAGEEETETIRKEINLVIEDKLNDIKSRWDLNATTVSSLQDELSKVEHRTYLWLKLIFDLIDDDLQNVTKEGRKRIFGSIPDSIDAAYTAILDKSSDKKRAQRLLSIVCAAVRPLSVKEMSIALAISPDHRAYADLEVQPESFSRALIRNLCGLFVTVVDGNVYLLHQTAKEFLIAQDDIRSTGDPSTGLWKQSVTTKDSNLILAQICMWYLLLAEFDLPGPFPSGHPQQLHFTEQRERIQNFVSQHYFLEYSATYWATHFRRAAVQENEPMVDLALEVYDAKSHRLMTWLSIYWVAERPHPDFPGEPDSLHLSSLLGHEQVMRRIIKDFRININIEDESGRTPIHWAAFTGNIGSMRVILENCSNEVRITKSVIVAAARNSESGKEMIHLLLENCGNEVNITKDLVLAAAQNYSSRNEVLQLLLEKRGDEFEITEEVVVAIAHWFQEEVILLLLEKRGDEVMITEKVVVAAAGNIVYEKEVIELLLDKRGDEVKITEEVVIKAAGNISGKEVIQLLLEKCGSEVTITEEVVVAAAGNSRSGKEVIELLLEKRGDEVTITEEVVVAAARNKWSGKKVIELLLDKRGSEVTITKKVIVAAVRNIIGKEVIQLLLEKRGSEVTITEDVVVAAVGNHKEVIQLLLEKRGSEVQITEKVVVAAVGNHKEVIQLLLEKRGDEVKITEDVVVRAAVNYDGKEIIQLLLEKRSDEVKITEEVVVRAAGNYNGREIMELLLEKRSDEVKITEEVVLAAAGNEEIGKQIIQLLLKNRGNEVKITEEVLKAAAGNEEIGKEIIQLLLENRGNEVKITEEVLKAATENGRVMQLLLEHHHHAL